MSCGLPFLVLPELYAFRLGILDAEYLEKNWESDLNRIGLADLDAATALVTDRFQGTDTSPNEYILPTIPEEKDEITAEKIRAFSLRHYSKNRVKVEASIDRAGGKNARHD